MSLQDDILSIEQEALRRIESADSPETLNQLRIDFLGKKGSVTALLKGLGELSIEERKIVGAAANTCRANIEAALETAAAKFTVTKESLLFDPTLPGTAQRVGVMHIVNQTITEISQIFHSMGFEVAKGPDVETDYYNFEALNFPPDHPARDMQDTIFLEGGLLLRTHTTPVQSRELVKRKPPFKIITPGKCFRNEAISTRSHVAFHQVDGFYVDEGVTMADLKGVLQAFCDTFFGEGLKLRFRPSYFPFTEPSAEVDISCFLCMGKGCQVCKHSGWLEILGCGMIDPNVLTIAGYDAEKYTGYAFGMGVERPAMLKYKITDIRHFFNNDIRFLRQFV